MNIMYKNDSESIGGVKPNTIDLTGASPDGDEHPNILGLYY